MYENRNIINNYEKKEEKNSYRVFPKKGPNVKHISHNHSWSYGPFTINND